jgi:hypothetical protein
MAVARQSQQDQSVTMVWSKKQSLRPATQALMGRKAAAGDYRRY